MKLTYEYFMQEYHRFRAVMGSTGYDMKQKLDAWYGLLEIYVMLEDLTAEENERVTRCMTALKQEVDARLGYQAITTITNNVLTSPDEKKQWQQAIALALF